MKVKITVYIPDEVVKHGKKLGVSKKDIKEFYAAQADGCVVEHRFELIEFAIDEMNLLSQGLTKDEIENP